MAGLTATGFEAKRLDTIIEDTKARWRSSYGSGVDTDTDSIIMVSFLPVFLELEELWQGAQGQYDFFNKNNAEGVSLDNLGAILNIPRLAGVKSTVDVQVSGSEGAIVPNNFKRSVEETLEPFQTTQSWTLPAVGSQPLIIEMTALNDGPVASVAGTLNQGTLPAGVTTMINAVDANEGTFDETDAEYRVGLTTRLAALGAGTVPSIKAALLTTTNVTSAIVFENAKDIADAGFSPALPPHSIRALVSGTFASQDVIDTLGVKKGAGTYTDGTVLGTYTDPTDGQTFPIRYSTVTDVLMYVTVSVLTYNSEYGDGTPDNGDDAVEAAVLALTWEVGEDAVLPKLQSAVTSVPGIITYTLFFDDAITPTTDTTVVIAEGEEADFDSSRTIVGHI